MRYEEEEDGSGCGTVGVGEVFEKPTSESDMLVLNARSETGRVQTRNLYA